MPKSYIHDEPGCQRAEQDGFDPFRQTLGRIQGFESIGHSADKIELLILGGTWSAYSKAYREWYVQRCYDAMNAGSEPHYRESPSLATARDRNATARHRNVGLVVETRPDWITPDEIVHLRQLGVTKVQMGVQSLDDRILALNNRGHDVAAVRTAVDLLRTAGFKLHLHWMPNLYGATPASDRQDFRRFFADPAIQPDELKIYPCSLIAGTELYRLYEEGAYRPYTEAELVDLLADVKPGIPPYTRVNRLFRDIPAHHIAAGVKTSNLREVVKQELARRGTHCGCIRCREISRQHVPAEQLVLQGVHLSHFPYRGAFPVLCGAFRDRWPTGSHRRFPAAQPCPGTFGRQPCVSGRDSGGRHDSGGACLWTCTEDRSGLSRQRLGPAHRGGHTSSQPGGGPESPGRIHPPKCDRRHGHPFVLRAAGLHHRRTLHAPPPVGQDGPFPAPDDVHTDAGGGTGSAGCGEGTPSAPGCGQSRTAVTYRWHHRSGPMTSASPDLPHGHSIAGVILTLNEVQHIAACIRSLQPFLDHIVVLDSGSSDGTRELARQCGASVLLHPFRDYAHQRQMALDLIQCEWILFVDADERIPCALGQEIREVCTDTTLNGALDSPGQLHCAGSCPVGADSARMPNCACCAAPVPRTGKRQPYMKPLRYMVPPVRWKIRSFISTTIPGPSSMPNS